MLMVHTIPYHTVLYYTILYCTILYYTCTTCATTLHLYRHDYPCCHIQPLGLGLGVGLGPCCHIQPYLYAVPCHVHAASVPGRQRVQRHGARRVYPAVCAWLSHACGLCGSHHAGPASALCGRGLVPHPYGHVPLYAPVCRRGLMAHVLRYWGRQGHRGIMP